MHYITDQNEKDEQANKKHVDQLIGKGCGQKVNVKKGHETLHTQSVLYRWLSGSVDWWVNGWVERIGWLEGREERIGEEEEREGEE